MIDQTLTELSRHFRGLAEDYPSDFRDRIKRELAESDIAITDLLFVSSALSAALHHHLLERSDREEIQRCSFCGKTQGEVRALVQGPISCICDECVDICVEILGEMHAKAKGS